MKILFKLIVIGTILISCGVSTSNKIVFNTKYQCWWNETLWFYEFRENGSFHFSTKGHYGAVSEIGSYEKINNYIQLNISNEAILRDKVMPAKFKIDKDGCLYDLLNIYYCIDLEEAIVRTTYDKNK